MDGLTSGSNENKPFKCRLCDEQATHAIGSQEFAYCEGHHKIVLEKVKFYMTPRNARRAEARKQNKVRRLW